MGEPTMTGDSGKITVEHLTTTLARMEDWCRAVRVALHSIPDKEAIEFPGLQIDEPFQAKQPMRPNVCPPPEPNQKPGSCPPPDKDN